MNPVTSRAFSGLQMKSGHAGFRRFRLHSPIRFSTRRKNAPMGEEWRFGPRLAPTAAILRKSAFYFNGLISTVLQKPRFGRRARENPEKSLPVSLRPDRLPEA